MDEVIKNKITNKKMFTSLVEEYVYKHDTPYIEAVVGVCEKRDIDPGHVAPLLSKSIKDKIEAEAISLKFLPEVNALPL